MRLLHRLYCVIAMTEKWKKIVDDGGIFGVLFTDVKLSTAFHMNVLLPNYNHGVFISMH